MQKSPYVAAPPSGARRFPLPSDVGTPAGWTPTTIINQSTPGVIPPGQPWERYEWRLSGSTTLVEDTLFDGVQVIATTENVTFRRCEFTSASNLTFYYFNYNMSGALIENCSFTRGTYADGFEAISGCGYTLKDSLVDGYAEGPHSSGLEYDNAQEVTIDHCYIRIAPYSQADGTPGEWHGDCLQAYYGPGISVTDTVLWVDETMPAGGDTLPEGTYVEASAGFFYPDQLNSGPVNIDGLVIFGSPIPFRLGKGPATVKDLYIVNNSWKYEAIDVDWSEVTAPNWNNCHVCTIDGNGQPVAGASLAYGS